MRNDCHDRSASSALHVVMLSSRQVVKSLVVKVQVLPLIVAGDGDSWWR